MFSVCSSLSLQSLGCDTSSTATSLKYIRRAATKLGHRRLQPQPSTLREIADLSDLQTDTTSSIMAATVQGQEVPSHEKTPTPWSELPAEMKHKIFRYLDCKDLKACRLVSTEAGAIASSILLETLFLDPTGTNHDRLRCVASYQHLSDLVRVIDVRGFQLKILNGIESFIELHPDLDHTSTDLAPKLVAQALTSYKTNLQAIAPEDLPNNFVMHDPQSFTQDLNPILCKFECLQKVIYANALTRAISCDYRDRAAYVRDIGWIDDFGAWTGNVTWSGLMGKLFNTSLESLGPRPSAWKVLGKSSDWCKNGFGGLRSMILTLYTAEDGKSSLSDHLHQQDPARQD